MAMTGGQFGNAYLGAMAINNPKVRAKTGGPLTLYPNENTVNARASFCGKIQKGGGVSPCSLMPLKTIIQDNVVWGALFCYEQKAHLFFSA
ncbi:hypothetical protein [Salmonella enterica]|uniref:hypothetical protein n=1 Tax=Salmonella enterica TaxID=28901 RepID=UPI001C44D58E|nr:hypothetical protein [Salmonella enterica]